MDKFVPATIKASTINGKLEMLPRAKFDVSALYYLKSNYTDDAKKKAFKDKYGYDLAPPDHLASRSRIRRSFSPIRRISTAPNLPARRRRSTVAFTRWSSPRAASISTPAASPPSTPTPACARSSLFVNLYKAKAVPAGTTNYLWDDLGQGFASGTIALDLDWPGWATFFNDPAKSKAAGNVGIVVQPMGSSGKHTGWSGSHGFSVTEACDHKDAAASLVWWLTNDDSQKIEAANGSLPTRTAVWEWDVAQAASDPYKKQVLSTFQQAAAYAFPVPPIAEWIEISNAVYPELQAAILGDKTCKSRARLRRRQGDEDPAGRGQTLTIGGRRAAARMPHRPPPAFRRRCERAFSQSPGQRPMKFARVRTPLLLLLPAIVVLLSTVATAARLFASIRASRRTG